jgi:hypothetical protein
MNVKPMILAFVIALAQRATAAPPVDSVREVKPIWVLDLDDRPRGSRWHRPRRDRPARLPRRGKSTRRLTDIHATVLYLLGLDSHHLEIPGRKRLEIEHGKPIMEILA